MSEAGANSRRLISPGRVAALVGVGLFFFMTGCQRHLIYYPATEASAVLSERARAEGYRPWRNEGGDIIGWRPERAEAGAGRVVVFHGNAGFALNRTYYADGFAALDGDWEVFLFEYPGYGARDGRPSEKAFFRSAEEAVGLLEAENTRPLLLVGESLGSGVATEMARRFPDRVTALLLITPFTDLAAVGSRHFPFLPVRLLLRDRYDNVRALQDYSGPVAVLLAGRDEVIPVDLGKKLYESYTGPKWLRVQEDRGHNTLDLAPAAPWWRELGAFLREHAGES